MKKKTFCGALGMLAVIAMTVFAYFLPSTDVSAESATSGTTTVTVHVINKKYPSAMIIYPSDGDVISDPELTLTYQFVYSRYTRVIIKNLTTGETTTLPDVYSSEEDGSGAASINLEDYGKYGDKFVFTVMAFSNDSFAEDSVTITYGEELPEIEVPNTGSFLTKLNITQTDYMITGVLAFFILSCGILVYLKKSRR